jgi:hypothetical protein
MTIEITKTCGLYAVGLAGLSKPFALKRDAMRLARRISRATGLEILDLSKKDEFDKYWKEKTV